MTSCIIIEDEPLAMQRLQSYIHQVPGLELTASFDNGTDAALYLRDHKPDLIFLDIHLGEISGLRLLETNAIKGNVIFTTAYHEHALRAFDLNVKDYLLKPFTFERFLQALDKVHTPLQNTGTKDFIFIKTEHRLEKVMFSELLYIEGMRDYRRIHTINSRIMTLQTFGDLEQMIPTGVACRIHKSYMVSISRIETIEKHLVRIGKREIPVSESYRKQFFEILKLR